MQQRKAAKQAKCDEQMNSRLVEIEVGGLLRAGDAVALSELRARVAVLHVPRQEVESLREAALGVRDRLLGRTDALGAEVAALRAEQEARHASLQKLPAAAECKVDASTAKVEAQSAQQLHCAGADVCSNFYQYTLRVSARRLSLSAVPQPHELVAVVPFAVLDDRGRDAVVCREAHWLPCQRYAATGQDLRRSVPWDEASHTPPVGCSASTGGSSGVHADQPCPLVTARMAPSNSGCDTRDIF